MKKLIKIRAWAEANFAEGSRPTNKTIRTWIDNGVIPGERIGHEYYVDLAKMRKTNNRLVDQVLAG